MPTLGLCTTDPEDSNMLPLSLCMCSLTCGAVMVQPDGTGRNRIVITTRLFLILRLCSLQAPVILYHRLFSHSSVPTRCCREIWSSPIMGDMILLPHPAVADMMVCALPQPGVNFLSVAAPPRVPMVIRWLGWVLTCCFPWRRESCSDGDFHAKVAWGKITIHWPELWRQRKLCTFGAYTCFPLVKTHHPVKQRLFSAAFYPVWHTPTEVNRSFTCSTGTEYT